MSVIRVEPAVRVYGPRTRTPQCRQLVGTHGEEEGGRALPQTSPPCDEHSKEATDAMRPKYGRMYGFEDATPPNAEMVAWTMFEYR